MKRSCLPANSAQGGLWGQGGAADASGSREAGAHPAQGREHSAGSWSHCKEPASAAQKGVWAWGLDELRNGQVPAHGLTPGAQSSVCSQGDFLPGNGSLSPVCRPHARARGPLTSGSGGSSDGPETGMLSSHC